MRACNAIAYHAVCDDATAFVWFERAVSAHEMWLTFLALDPRLKRLRVLAGRFTRSSHSIAQEFV